MTTGPTFESRSGTVLPPADYLTDITHASYDLWPDGEGFPMAKPVCG